MPIEPAIGRTIWEIKYRRRRADGETERSLAETWERVATALAVPETGASAAWEKRFRQLLRTGRFLPGGRIVAGAGTADPVTLFNCFVLPAPAGATFGRTLREAEATMRRGAGSASICPGRSLAHPAWSLGSGSSTTCARPWSRTALAAAR